MNVEVPSLEQEEIGEKYEGGFGESRTTEEYVRNHPDSILLKPDPPLGENDFFVYHITKAANLGEVEREGLWSRQPISVDDSSNPDFHQLRIMADSLLDKNVPEELKKLGLNRGGAVFAEPDPIAPPTDEENTVLKIKVGREKAYIFDTSWYNDLAFRMGNNLRRYMERNNIGETWKNRKNLMQDEKVMEEISDELVERYAGGYWASLEPLGEVDYEDHHQMYDPEVLFVGARPEDIRIVR